MKKADDEISQPGTADFKTVKAGCGIRFDPDALDEEAGFDFSQAEQLKQENPPAPKDTDEHKSPDRQKKPAT